MNKFERDAALCVLGAPVSCDDPAGDALRAARRLAERLLSELPEIDFGIGGSAGGRWPATWARRSASNTR